MDSVTIAAGEKLLANTHFNPLRKDVIVNGGEYAAATGSVNAYEVSVDAQLTALEAGLIIKFKANLANTGAVTVDVNSIGAVAIKKNVSEALIANDIPANKIVAIIYDGTNFQYLNAPGGGGVSPDYVIMGFSGMSVGATDFRKSAFFLSNGDIAVPYSNYVINTSEGNAKHYAGIKSINSGSFSTNEAKTLIEISGTEYIIGKYSGGNSFQRTDSDGQNDTAITISGTAPTAYNAPLCFDFTNGHLLILDGTASTTIRRYTVSGSTITNINSDITLDTTPDNAQTMFINGDYLYLENYVSNTLTLWQFNLSTGALVDTLKFGINYTAYPAFLIDRNSNYYVSMGTRNTYGSAGFDNFYKIDL